MNYLTTFFKGMAMGAADVVPGVSGGTIAFITGIYDTLLESIRRINPSILGLWKREGFKAAFNHINGFFLISLFGGILTSILTLAKFITWMLHTHPIPLWSFFFGLILISIVHIAKKIEKWSLDRFVMLFAGAAFAYSITVLNPMTMTPSTFTYILAGSIAICAMILPGISGSFILLLIGMYGPVLGAVKSLDLVTMGLFASGCLIGLLSFSHVLSFLLRKFRDITLIFLTGLMAGTLGKIWPWKEVLEWRTNSKGEQVPLIEQNLSPFNYEQVTQQPALIGFAVFGVILGIGLVLGLEMYAKKNEKES
ncbi:DUF368 domain-containing protein [Aliivibrio fischeri]|uniref:DUF368 domain-containing protein n=1 Tax=Aliivibrio fischeri TaxID=668 RepID=UPI00107ED6DC|nr:DUF368 domain-containing protein [Aliivibrio fischeri]MCE7565391.1 DUF368 domain-containing protein [Aliivibrio fischeri]TGA68445.1 DUF368 domain-containing protein [Aliivibrio fischeri]